jgi:hypothetical protein
MMVRADRIDIVYARNEATPHTMRRRRSAPQPSPLKPHWQNEPTYGHRIRLDFGS